jgi:hypothetical protein
LCAYKDFFVALVYYLYFDTDIVNVR